MLGLKRAHGKTGFRLPYLWYDVLGKIGATHRAEVETFAAIAKNDNVVFHSMTYQELIVKMAQKLPKEHDSYVQYLVNRCL